MRNRRGSNVVENFIWVEALYKMALTERHSVCELLLTLFSHESNQINVKMLCSMSLDNVRASEACEPWIRVMRDPDGESTCSKHANHTVIEG